MRTSNTRAFTIRPIFINCLCLLLLSSCAHRIIRTGYITGGNGSQSQEPAITKKLERHDSLKLVGEVELKDSGFSTSCSESHAVSILLKEARFVDAQVIHITEERRADPLSSCYRCKAKFYVDARVHSPIVSDAAYQETEIHGRVADDRRNSAAMVLVVAAGIVAGALLSTVLFR